jgi:hypothetical protein
VPPRTQVALPSSSHLPREGHVCSLPGGSAIQLPLAEGRDHWEVAVPCFCQIVFSLSEPRKLGRVNLPAGSSIILPGTSHDEFKVTLPAGSLVTPPPSLSTAPPSNAEALDDVTRTEGTVLVPTGRPSDITTAGGSVIR